MERKYLNDLIARNNDTNKKPLMVWGARQVGKTYLIEELFAKNFYKGKYLRIDCSDDTSFTQYALKNPSLDKVLDFLKINYRFNDDGKHLLIFDEAQECLPLVKMMKHFCEKRRDIPLIVTGSLVRLKIFRDAHKRGVNTKNSKFIFPVGKINQLYMYPLTFDEFVYNYNKSLYDYLKTHFNNNITIDYEVHEELLKVFNDYLFIGGMPEVVETFINESDDKYRAYNLSIKKLNEIYDNYLADMDLYQASPESIIRSRHVYNDIYKQLNKENKNFKFSLSDNGARGRDMINPIAWLVEARVVNQSFLLKEKISSPLIKEEDSLMRLYLADSGIFTHQSGMNAKTFFFNDMNSLSGIFYENYVSTELSARGYNLFYWKGKRNSEFEFILDIDSRIIPIEVIKSRGKLNSLKEFRQHNKKDLVIKVSSTQCGFDKNNLILTIPFYYFSFFLDALKEGGSDYLDKLIESFN